MKDKIIESTLVKKPHQKFLYTKDQLLEFARCADPITGPKYFLNNYFWTQHPTKGRMQYKAYVYQENMLDVMHNNRKSVLLCGRQLGKCLKNCINITIRSKQGEVYVIPIGEFYEYERAKRDGNNLPDISSYRQKRT